MCFAACLAAGIKLGTQQQRVSWSLLAHRPIASGKPHKSLVFLLGKPLKALYPFKNRLEQCIRGDAEAPSLALYLMGPALLRVGRTQDQLVAPTVAGKLCPDHQDLKAVMLPSFAHPHSTSTDSLCECELKLIMQQLANSFQAVILTFKCRGMP